MLIEDLVEASRASSGNITLECDTIDFNELVMQVAGTYVEKYSQRQLTLVTRSHQEPILIWADGRRMYRVLDNLFNNAFKYAMTGSRVYVDLYEDEDRVCFIMKNISQEPLNITADGADSALCPGGRFAYHRGQRPWPFHRGEPCPAPWRYI